MRCTSIGDMNCSQSCVPFGTRFVKFSATTMAPNQEQKVLLNVVMKIDPPGFVTSMKQKKINFDKKKSKGS